MTGPKHPSEVVTNLDEEFEAAYNAVTDDNAVFLPVAQRRISVGANDMRQKYYAVCAERDELAGWKNDRLADIQAMSAELMELRYKVKNMESFARRAQADQDEHQAAIEQQREIE